MFNPCVEHCKLRYDREYTQACDASCYYAAVVKENKKLKSKISDLSREKLLGSAAHIIGIDVHNSGEYSAVVVMCNSCKHILHSKAYPPEEVCFNIPYYTKCPQCGKEIHQHPINRDV